MTVMRKIADVMGLLLAVMIVGGILRSSPVVAASFDCAKAGTPVEKAICADAEASSLDERLAAEYRQATASGDAAALTKAQRAWLKSVRNRCRDAVCLRAAYQARLAELAQHADTAAPNAIAGEYTREGGATDSAKITLRDQPDGRIYVQGEALWVGNAALGNVHIGTLDGAFEPENGKIQYSDGEDDGCRLTIALVAGALTVSDDNMRCGGANVSFNGRYRKTKAAR